MGGGLFRCLPKRCRSDHRVGNVLNKLSRNGVGRGVTQAGMTAGLRKIEAGLGHVGRPCLNKEHMELGGKGV